MLKMREASEETEERNSEKPTVSGPPVLADENWKLYSSDGPVNKVYRTPR